jgi:hypothetical protein
MDGSRKKPRKSSAFAVTVRKRFIATLNTCISTVLAKKK